MRADRGRQRARLRDRDDDRRGHRPGVGRAQFLGGWRLCGDIGGTRRAAAGRRAWPRCAAGGGVRRGRPARPAGAGWVGHWTRQLDLDGVSRCPTSAVFDGDHVGPLVPRLVPHPPLDGAGVGRVDVRREGLAGHVDVEVELTPRLVVDLVLDVEDRALAARGRCPRGRAAPGRRPRSRPPRG